MPCVCCTRFVVRVRDGEGRAKKRNGAGSEQRVSGPSGYLVLQLIKWIGWQRELANISCSTAESLLSSCCMIPSQTVSISFSDVLNANTYSVHSH